MLLRIMVRSWWYSIIDLKDGGVNGSVRLWLSLSLLWWTITGDMAWFRSQCARAAAALCLSVSGGDLHCFLRL